MYLYLIIFAEKRVVTIHNKRRRCGINNASEISKKYLTTAAGRGGQALSIGATAVVVIVYVIHSSNTNNINITAGHARCSQTGMAE